ncbi:DUF1841 family protein [Burkholderiaceae bacterium DAT-1]|nr:DUF1841 family protein [Burkholderiaceae bacterium DAT-1]
MFNPSRDQARQFLFDAWQKFRAQQALTDLEKIAASILAEHPEYHAIFEHPDRTSEREYHPESGETNPFLHISMHLAMEEQLSIDQPAGVRALFEQLCVKTGNRHDAQHEMMDCLAEMIWHAQRNRTEPDANIYLGCLRRKCGLSTEA